MKSKTHIIVQLLLTLVQLGNAFSESAGKYKFAVLAGVSILQAVVGVLNHYFNPDGTAAEVSWVK